MVKMLGLGPVFDSMGLINTIYSYVDDIAISFTADRDMMPDPENYATALNASFAALRDAAAVRDAPNTVKTKVKEKA